MHTMRRGTFAILPGVVLSVAAMLRADAPRDDFRLGRQSYDAGRYDQALEHFQQAFREQPGSVERSFMLGLAAVKTGDYESAAAAFERVLAMRPDLDRARLELARAYYHLQLYTVAETLFREVADKSETPAAVRSNIDIYLQRIADARREHRFGGALTVSLVRDSNARVSPDDTIIIPALPPLHVPRERDWFVAQSLVLEHRWKPAYHRLGWQTGLLGYNAFYNTADDLDVNYVRVDSGPAAQFGRWSAGLAGNAALMEKDHDRYLGSAGARVWTAADLNARMTIRFEWRGEARRYWQDEEADGFSNTVSIKPAYVKGPHTLLADLGVERHDADADHETFERWFATLSYQLSLPWELTVLTAYTYENWLFEDPDLLADQRRRDRVHEVSLGMRKRLTRQVAMDLKHSFERSNSTFSLYDFERNVTSLSLTVVF